MSSMSSSRRLAAGQEGSNIEQATSLWARDLPMARGSDEVEHSMDTVVSESGVTLDT